MANSYSNFGSMSEKSGVQNWKTTDGLYFQDEQYARWHQEYLDEKSSSGFTGKGKKKRQDGIYEGDLVDGKAHGKGKMTYTDGMVFEGTYVNDLADGKGKMYFDGKVYEVVFVNGKLDKSSLKEI
jgi:hypothetical protein